ncbi:MAG: pyridoxal phosphate-dependent aminotransferase [Bacteroidales bacterium]|nr:pyridoxal phosphate-dependent aminotransferase [Bacteroidales bacterium]
MAENPKISGSLIGFFSNLVKTKGGINLAQGIPGFQPPKELIEILSQTINENYHQYAPGLGNLKLINEIQKLYPKINKKTTAFITTGATEAISLIYTYLNKKLKSELNVLAFSPAYETYIHLPKIFGNNFYSVSNKANSYFDKDELQKSISDNKIKLIFVASPGNPYGKILTKDEFEFLIDICNTNKIYLIIDAVYSDLYLTKEKPYYPTDKISEYIFYVNSFSKKFSITGWRIGYFLCHNSHVKEISYIHDYIGLSGPAPLQEALARYLEKGNTQHYIDKIKKTIFDNMNFAENMLNNNKFNCLPTDGGYFIWAKLPENFDDGLKFGLDLYEKHQTAIIPGQHFGNEWKKYIRINIAREKEEFDKGIKNIIKYVGF